MAIDDLINIINDYEFKKINIEYLIDKIYGNSFPFILNSLSLYNKKYYKDTSILVEDVDYKDYLSDDDITDDRQLLKSFKFNDDDVQLYLTQDNKLLLVTSYKIKINRYTCSCCGKYNNTRCCNRGSLYDEYYYIIICNKYLFHHNYDKQLCDNKETDIFDHLEIMNQRCKDEERKREEKMRHDEELLLVFRRQCLGLFA